VASLKAHGRGTGIVRLALDFVAFHNRISSEWPVLQLLHLRAQLLAVFGLFIGRGIPGSFLIDRIRLTEHDGLTLVGNACTRQGVQGQNDDRSLHAGGSSDYLFGKSISIPPPIKAQEAAGAGNAGGSDLESGTRRGFTGI
jgi:hypothetical protein